MRAAFGVRPGEKRDLQAYCWRIGSRVKIAYLSPGLQCPLDAPKVVLLADSKELTRRQGLVAPRKGETGSAAVFGIPREWRWTERRVIYRFIS